MFHNGRIMVFKIFGFQSPWEGTWTETNEPTSGVLLIVDIINGRFKNNLQDSRRMIEACKGFKRRHSQI